MKKLEVRSKREGRKREDRRREEGRKWRRHC